MMKKMLNLALATAGMIVLVAGNSFAATIGGYNSSSSNPFGAYTMSGTIPTLGAVGTEATGTGGGTMLIVSPSVTDSVGFGQWKVKVRDAAGNVRNFWYSVQEGTEDNTTVKQETFVRADSLGGNDAVGAVFTQSVKWTEDGNTNACSYGTINAKACFKTDMTYNGLGGSAYNKTMNINMVATEPASQGNTAAYDFRTQFDFNQTKASNGTDTPFIRNNFSIDAQLADSSNYTQSFKFEQKQADTAGASQDLSFNCQFVSANCNEATIGADLSASGTTALKATINRGTDPEANRLINVYFSDSLDLDGNNSSTGNTDFKWESINKNPNGTGNDWKYQVF